MLRLPQPDCGRLESFKFGTMTLDFTKIGIAVRSFRNLFYHRTVLLEGIRRMAARNLIHLAEAQRHCGVKSSEEVHEWIPRVQARMLRDQGMENNSANRKILPFATFTPVQVYLALLYAELECVRDWQGQSKILGNERLRRCLCENEKAINKLRRYRNSFLHPKPTADQREQEYLADSESFYRTRGMQEELDLYLLEVNSVLVDALKDLLDRLPENDRLICEELALKATSDWMTLHCDQEGLKNVETQQKKLLERRERLDEAGHSWTTPSPRQTAKLVELAGYMSTVERSHKEYQFEVVETRQSPMQLRLVMPLLSGDGSDRYGDSRAARQAIRSDSAIRRLLMAGAVMRNENDAWIAGHSREKPRSTEEFKAVVSETLGRGLTELNLAIAPARLATALLYEPLRCYSELKQKDPLVHDDTLSAFTGGSLDTLCEFRNSVFHVWGPDRDPKDVDAAVAETFVNNGDRLYLGLAGFFGMRYRPPA